MSYVHAPLSVMKAQKERHGWVTKDGWVSSGSRFILSYKHPRSYLELSDYFGLLGFRSSIGT